VSPTTCDKESAMRAWNLVSIQSLAKSEVTPTTNVSSTKPIPLVGENQIRYVPSLMRVAMRARASFQITSALCVSTMRLSLTPRLGPLQLQ
jgi:hypothetical protein